jgi:hypothetical protein
MRGSFFLLILEDYEIMRDEFFKWDYIPVTQVGSRIRESVLAVRACELRLGIPAKIAAKLLPEIGAIRNTIATRDQQLALIQTVEAIRMYAAEQPGQFPRSLDELPVPAPLIPFTNKPFDYQSDVKSATLLATGSATVTYRLELTFAP